MSVTHRWLALLVAIAGCGDQITEVVDQAPPPKPNIIVIMTDDQLVGTVAYMPRVTQDLVNHGVTFDNAFVTTPLCCPSRATFLTGRYPHNHGVLSNSSATGGGFDSFHQNGNEARTLAVWLQGVGYRTALVGKYLNHYPGTMAETYIPPGWSDWRAVLNSERYLNYRLNENGAIVRYGAGAEDYQTDVLRRHALAIITAAHEAEQPLFMLVTPMAPHEPHVPALRHAGHFAGTRVPRTPNFNEADVSDKALPVKNLPLLTPTEVNALDQEYAARLETLLAVDEMAGALVDSLRALGMLDNTFIIFTTDNGYHLGNHRLLLGKGSPYEEDLRIPLIVRGPGIPTMHSSAIVLNTDLAPTVGEWAGAVVPEFVDGKSFSPQATGAAPPWRQSFHSEFNNQFTGVHTRTYSFIRFSMGEQEYYDLTVDPYQLENIAPALTAFRRAQLRRADAALGRCAAATCRSLEAAAP